VGSGIYFQMSVRYMGAEARDLLDDWEEEIAGAE